MLVLLFVVQIIIQPPRSYSPKSKGSTGNNPRTEFAISRLSTYLSEDNGSETTWNGRFRSPVTALFTTLLQPCTLVHSCFPSSIARIGIYFFGCTEKCQSSPQHWLLHQPRKQKNGTAEFCTQLLIPLWGYKVTIDNSLILHRGYSSLMFFLSYFLLLLLLLSSSLLLLICPSSLLSRRVNQSCFMSHCFISYVLLGNKGSHCVYRLQSINPQAI